MTKSFKLRRTEGTIQTGRLRTGRPSSSLCFIGSVNIVV